MNKGRILELVDIFSDLKPKQLELVYQLCKEMIFEKGEIIVEEQSPSTEIYIIMEGEVDVVVGPQGKSRRIALLQKGQTFGEIALVDQGLRSASVRCISETCRVFLINRDDFIRLMKTNLDMGFSVMYNLAADLCLRIRQTTYLVRDSLLYVPPKES
jgi:CRP/FNR family cyclic AMP-dependent transcriptional regulator